jgi:hypothetical protein
MGRFPWSDFFKKKLVYKVLGSLTRCKPNVDQEEWTYTKKWLCWFSLIYVRKMIVLKRKINKVWPLSCLHLLFPNKNSLNFYYYNILMSWAHAPALCYQTTSFASPQRKTRWTMSVDNVGLKICLLETLDFMVTLTFIVFLDVIQNGPKTSSTTNHEFYRALGRLHGPWCKRSLSVMWASHGMEVCLVSERAVQFNTWECRNIIINWESMEVPTKWLQHVANLFQIIIILCPTR